MQVTINIPRDAEDQFRQAFGPDLDEAATEALLINGYRTGRISLGMVGEFLGLPTSLAAQEWLAGKGVPLNYDAAELEADRRTLRELFDIEL